MTTAEVRRHRIELEDLDSLLKLRFKGNPKKHDQLAIKESIDEFGFVMPVLVDEGQNLLGAGHGRLKDLESRRDGKEKRPEGIGISGAGAWLVPVIRGVRFKSATAYRKYVIADNRIGERGGWDNDVLLAQLTALRKDLVGTGYVEEDVRLLAASRNPWVSDIATVDGHGAHLEAIPGRVMVKCRSKDTEAIREMIEAGVKRRGFKSVEVI